MRLFLNPFALFPLATLFNNSFTDAHGNLFQDGPIQVGEVFYNLRDWPYCEFLINVLNPDNSTSQYVFNSLGFNDCPLDWYNTLTTQSFVDAYTIQYNSTPYSAGLNGHRFFAMDIINQTLPVPQATLVVNNQTLGLRGIVAVLAGTPLVGGPPFDIITIARNSTWTYLKDHVVHNLVDPNGTIFTMQSYTQQVVADLTSKDLDKPDIGGLLKLPTGWSYETRRLQDRLDNVANGVTNTVSDNLRNGYQITPTIPLYKGKTGKKDKGS